MLLGLWISLAAAVLPTVLYVLIFYWADRYEREPFWLAAVAFIWGAIPAIVLSAILELLIGAPFIAAPGSLAASLVEDAVVAPIVEEVMKALPLLWLFYRRRQEFDGVLDGLIYGSLIGFGFETVENFLYFVGVFAANGYGALTVNIVLRAVIFGLGHAFYTGLVGIGLGLARNRANPARTLLMLGGLAAAILAHALHNLGAALMPVTGVSILLSFMMAGAGLGLLLIAVGLAWQHERNTIHAELADEVGVLLTEQEYADLTGRWRRPVRRRGMARASRAQLLVEYANRKQRLRLNGASREPELSGELAGLRRRLALPGAPALAA